MATPGKVRLVLDCTYWAYGLNRILEYLDVHCGFLRAPRWCVHCGPGHAGLNPALVFIPVSRRLLEVRRRLLLLLAARLPLPCSRSPPPGRDGRGAKEVLCVAILALPALGLTGFVGSLRLVKDESGCPLPRQEVEEVVPSTVDPLAGVCRRYSADDSGPWVAFGGQSLQDLPEPSVPPASRSSASRP